MPKHQKPVKKAKNAIDTFSKKRGRGRPQRIPRPWVTGRAENYRTMLAEAWPRLSAPLLRAETSEQVIAAFEPHGQPYANEFVPRLASDILALIHGPSFPIRPKARIGFLADSLAGRPSITFRSSRDICVKERTKQRAQSPHKVIRKEFYIECECGYKGPAREDACRKCGATIPLSLGTLLGHPGSF